MKYERRTNLSKFAAHSNHGCKQCKNQLVLDLECCMTMMNGIKLPMKLKGDLSVYIDNIIIFAVKSINTKIIIRIYLP